MRVARKIHRPNQELRLGHPACGTRNPEESHARSRVLPPWESDTPSNRRRSYCPLFTDFWPCPEARNSTIGCSGATSRTSWSLMCCRSRARTCAARHSGGTRLLKSDHAVHRFPATLPPGRCCPQSCLDKYFARRRQRPRLEALIDRYPSDRLPNEMVVDAEIAAE